MSFFYVDVKAAAPKTKPKIRLADIPVTSLQKMGCSVCKRNDDPSLKNPKMSARGEGDVFLLTAAPTQQDDIRDRYLQDEVHGTIARMFGRTDLIVSGAVQCAGDHVPDITEIECCRNRVVEDIETTKPVVIVTVGDPPLAWATGLTSAIPHRGTLMVAKIGRHVCYVFPILYPNYILKKGKGGKSGSEYELTLKHDIARIKALLPWMHENPAVVASNYGAGIEIITGQEPGDMQRLEKGLQELSEAPRNALDIEANTLRPFRHKRPLLLTAAVGTFERTIAFAIDHPDGWGSTHQKQRAREAMFEFLMNSGRTACHNLAFEMEWLIQQGGAHALRRKTWDDTMASAYTLDERGSTKSLGTQTVIHFGFDLKAQSRIDAKHILDYPIKEVLVYNGMDTKWTNALRDKHAGMLDAVEGFRELYEDKCELAATLALTTAKGLPVNQAFADAAVKRLEDELKVIEAKISRDEDIRDYTRKHGTFSPTNPEHMLRLLKDMQRPEIKVPVKGADRDAFSYSTSEEVLTAIGDAVPCCAHVLEHRGISKLLGTYVLPTANGANVDPDGRIRSSYNSMVAVTDRLSADDPAVQNWPKRKHKWVRGMIGTETAAEKDLEVPKWFVALDYGQIEFRVVGMASEDRNLVKYCWTGYDVHKAWAERLVKVYPRIIDWTVRSLGVDWDEKGIKTLRQEMKNKWVFPQLFGSTTHSCAQNLELPDDVAEDLGAEFWDEFREVKDWQDKVMRGYEKNLYVETLTGTRRRGPTSRNEAINMPIQGTAAAIVKKAMTALSLEAELRDDPELQPSLNVHDDLSTIMADATMEPKLDLMAAIMCKHRYNFINVPLIVEASIGPNWADLEEIKVYRSNEIYNLRNPYAP